MRARPVTTARGHSGAGGADYTGAMPERSLIRTLYRSLSTAWTKNHEGPPWAPWVWTLLINTVIGLILSLVLTGPTGGVVNNVVISQGIGLSVHFLFWALGNTLKIEMFGLPMRVRLVYVTTVVVVGSWIGFTLGMLVLNRDPQLVLSIVQRRWGGLITFPLISALVMIVMLTAVSRYPGAPAGRRTREERSHPGRPRSHRSAPGAAERPDRAALPVQHAGPRARAGRARCAGGAGHDRLADRLPAGVLAQHGVDPGDAR